MYLHKAYQIFMIYIFHVTQASLIYVTHMISAFLSYNGSLAMVSKYRNNSYLQIINLTLKFTRVRGHALLRGQGHFLVSKEGSNVFLFGDTGVQ